MLFNETMRRAAVHIVVLILLLAVSAASVDRRKFRTCTDTAFCRRLRDVRTHGPFATNWAELQQSSRDDGALRATMYNKMYPRQSDLLQADISALGGPSGDPTGVVRILIDQKQPRYKRFRVYDVVQGKYNGTIVNKLKRTNDQSKKRVDIEFGNVKVTTSSDPFRVDVSVGGQVLVKVNPDDLLEFEVYRDKRPRPETDVIKQNENGEKSEESGKADPLPEEGPYDEPGMWSESFGGHTDDKKYGPSAVALDFAFPNAQHLYGLPEHASNLSLPTTRGPSSHYQQPYRLYNLDVFEFELNEPMALYGSIPFLLAHGKLGTVGLLWLNAAETFVDVSTSPDLSKSVHFMSESGIIEAYIFTGPTPRDIFRQYAELTGFPAMPQRFSVAYHQCRWNYKDEADVDRVDAGFDEHDLPYDVLWLDIEHTDSKKYFTWDKSHFPNPAAMQEKIDRKTRKMVTIIDPHIKRDESYHVHKMALDSDYYVKKSDGSVYEGWCWPGSVSYLDFTNSAVRTFWAKLFQFSVYEGSTPTLYTWNDMNEPSVFNGPEVTMPKDCVHHDGFEHRDYHNLYGAYLHQATALGHLTRSQNTDRPFVLSRAFFAGSQRFGPIWTGDNTATWEHLASSLPMLMSLNVAGLSFAGADVGGFFKDPDAELLVRWYQAAAFQPFFRGHAHIDTKRREPWLFDTASTLRIRDALKMRYSLLPYIYTVFREASTTGHPIMRPLWADFPSDDRTFAIEDEHLFGPDLLVRPVTRPGQTEVMIYFPGHTPLMWYDIRTFMPMAAGQIMSVPALLDWIPVYQRAGSIIPKQERLRRSSALMVNDPYSLFVALDSDGKAIGTLYLDDGRSFAYQTGAYQLREFTVSNHGNHFTIQSTKKEPSSAKYFVKNLIERIVIMGLNKKLKSIESKDTKGGVRQIEFKQTLETGIVVLRKPNVPIGADFQVSLNCP